ncbi:hypothetical protein AB0H73_34045 [Streptomyces olivoreticuli]|uniref:hypothetical protein n=1 Tax=Streptomyces olivoreticuli TaxID=68246 RepID=UPI0013C2AD64|nr:hypothetical protein [Streptomyces olivoreticuli]
MVKRFGLLVLVGIMMIFGTTGVAYVKDGSRTPDGISLPEAGGPLPGAGEAGVVTV